MRISLTFSDILIIAVYFFLLFLIGFLRRKKDPDTEDFLLSGRRLTLPLFVMTLVSTWYGGILGVGEFTYLHGLSNWFVMGFPYYVFAFIYALFIAGRIRRNMAATIPELIDRRYGRIPSFVSGLFVFLMTSPAPYLLIAGIILSLIIGLSPLICALLIFIASAVYLYRKGFSTVIQSDVLQFGCMFLGFIILSVILFRNYPAAEFLSTEHLPAQHLSLTGGLSATYIISWFFIALWTLVDPGFHQRCAAARTPRTARNGILLSIAFWLIFDALTVVTGLYARALLPDIQSLYSYPLLAAKVLPAGLLGLFIAGLLATVMSTLDSYIFISAQTIGYDIISKYRPGNIRANIRFGYVVTGIIAMIILILLPSVISIWYVIGTLVIPSLLLPVLSVLFDRPIPPNFVLALMSGAVLLSGTWFLIGAISGTYPLNIEPFYPGLLYSMIVFLIGRKRFLAGRQQDKT
ncbi:MAG: sodium:solute symporter family protein [Candidatus Marinimicrobia bacterium]|nr:sodium:solute symporter family protein [Candidatus Neomarinimicrobiota bacterium]